MKLKELKDICSPWGRGGVTHTHTHTHTHISQSQPSGGEHIIHYLRGETWGSENHRARWDRRGNRGNTQFAVFVSPCGAAGHTTASLRVHKANVTALNCPLFLRRCRVFSMCSFMGAVKAFVKTGLRGKMIRVSEQQGPASGSFVLISGSFFFFLPLLSQYMNIYIYTVPYSSLLWLSKWSFKALFCNHNPMDHIQCYPCISFS